MSLSKLILSFGLISLMLPLLSSCGPTKCSEITAGGTACGSSQLEGGCKWDAGTSKCSATPCAEFTDVTKCPTARCNMTAAVVAKDATCTKKVGSNNATPCPDASVGQVDCVAVADCEYSPEVTAAAGRCVNK